ncbi:MAG: hypothetical protein ACR2IE_09700 [Candidatus Sumerlaeaceae bacterium]
MKRSFVSTVLLVLAFAGTFSASVFYQHKGIKAVLANPPFYETWQLAGRSGAAMRIAALRYDLVAADFLWLRSIQSFGGRGMTNRDWRPMYNMFDTITELDPYFADAYTFGNLVIGDEGGKLKEGLELLHKGTFNVYRQYRIPFEGMYVSHWEMNDEKSARWYGRLASKRKDAPDWAGRIVAYIDVQAGAFYLGFDRFVGQLLQGVDARELPIQDIAVNKLKETVEKWNASIMMQAVDQFTSTTGRLPNNIAEIVKQPALQNYEVGMISKLIAAVERHARDQGRPGIIPLLVMRDTALPPQFELQKPSVRTTETLKAASLLPLQDVVFKEALVKRSGVPEEPYGTSYSLNLALLGNPKEKPEDVIAREPKLNAFTADLLVSIRNAISTRRDELGRNPRDLKEVFLTDFNTTEPSGGKWEYDQNTGSIKSTARPEL